MLPVLSVGLQLDVLNEFAATAEDEAYSWHWAKSGRQLGKSMALADRAYTIALTRARKEITDIAVNNTKIKVLEAVGTPHKSRLNMVEGLKESLARLERISKAEDTFAHDMKTCLRKT